jgi:hypothetical protein
MCFVHEKFFMKRTAKRICSCGKGVKGEAVRMDQNLFGETFLVDPIL